jgi:peptidoglycan/LPS O-acetylase OafA/YrhL
MRLKVIDFLRGYSIFTIVVMHLSKYFALPRVFQSALIFGGAGVHVFILVSGFGLCLSQMNKPLPYFLYLKRRLTKVYIPYIIIIAISALIPFLYNDNRLFAFLSHAFLFKMFSENLMNSFGLQFWFISMIICLYLIFPFLFNMVTKNKWIVVICSFSISLLYATIVGLLDKSGLRIWNSFFLQYLGEFSLGMMIAVKYKKNPEFVKIPSKWLLLVLSIIGIAITGYTGIKGGVLKLYNDIPSLIGYLSLALLIYSFGIKWINRFFTYTNVFSYEWYLIHILTFTCLFHFFQNNYLMAILALILSYGLAILYNHSLKKFYNQ